jgi:hypothetical protein
MRPVSAIWLLSSNRWQETITYNGFVFSQPARRALDRERQLEEGKGGGSYGKTVDVRTRDRAGSALLRGGAAAAGRRCPQQVSPEYCEESRGVPVEIQPPKHAR